MEIHHQNAFLPFFLLRICPSQFQTRLAKTLKSSCLFPLTQASRVIGYDNALPTTFFDPTIPSGTHGPETFETLFLQHRAGWKSFHWRIGPKISLFQSFETQRRTPTSRPPAQGWHEIRRSFKASLRHYRLQ